MKIIKNDSLYIYNSDIYKIRYFSGKNLNLSNLRLYYNNDSKKASDFLLVDDEEAKDFIISLDYIINFGDCIILSDEEIDKEIVSYEDDIDIITNNNNYDNLESSNLEIEKYNFMIKQLEEVKKARRGKSKIIFPDFIQDNLPKVSESRMKKLIKSLPRL